MKKYFNYSILILVIFLALYYGYTRMTDYYISGSIDTKRIADIAIQQSDPLACSKIRTSAGSMNSTQSLQDECYMKVAKELKDKNICEKVSTQYQHLCYLDLASILNDESLCELTDYSAGVCYGSLARKNNDVKICDKVLDESFKNRCYVEFTESTGDISICDNKINNALDKDHCYFAVVQSFFQRGKVLTATEKKICERIVSKDIYYDCLQYHYDSTNRN